ncbi:Bacterial type II secretion system protein F domain protein [Posidoniimonas polymericola]|uniref:Bacterial type II secretion system protein F domain protein n=1 Tax=Posidoniimonas polymericola TaxID=2528002 RepID=A0A5C5YPX9_9BACT|nr:type II secretion system F family protein [Posidoniimonas polymericola]TWT76848.1 Bacterial type II secretion system protein F domain protein [Posidoniimonas polymericola]
MSPWIIYASVFGGVALMVAAVSALLRGDKDADMEDRLSVLTGQKSAGKAGAEASVAGDMMRVSVEGAGLLEKSLVKYLNLKMMFEQADVSFTVSKFLLVCVVSGTIGFVLPTLAGLPVKFAPIVAAIFLFLPFLWLMMKRKSRLKKFAAQLPEALELIARALRAGHSLGAGMNLVAQEMSAPIAKEFGRAFEEQNLGMPMEETLDHLADRVPNLDLKFFVTAVVLQRQTGGDLAEILDKIGRLIRERFKIWGQVQALTGEGRLSGIVLLALPPTLFATVYQMNPDYLMLLFTDELGKKMLVGGVVMQLLGAIVIRKIINIRV